MAQRGEIVVVVFFSFCATGVFYLGLQIKNITKEKNKETFKFSKIAKIE